MTLNNLLFKADLLLAKLTRADADFDESKHPRDNQGQFTAAGRNDPAVVNVPLAKRGNIDNEIDRYKAQQAAETRAKEKERAQTKRTAKQEAKELLAEWGDKIIVKHGAKFGEKELRKMLDGWSKWEPEKLIMFVRKFEKEQAADA